MRNRFFKGIQIRFLAIFMVSILCATVTILIIQSLLMSVTGFSSKDIAKIEEDYAYLYFIAFLVLTTIIFFIFSRSIIKRIKNINDYVSEVKGGNFDDHIEDNSKDEVGELSNGINDMVNTIKEYIEQQKRSEEVKNEMIGNISHDLRTPMTSLSGYIELLKYNIHDPDVSREYLNIIDMKCNVLRSQINDLLDYCNLKSREIKLEIKRIGVKSLLEQVIVDFIPQMEKEGMDFILEIKRKDLYIDVDINLFVRLLQNIINNAIIYGKPGKRVKIEAFSKGREAIIRIINYGQAIPKEDVQFIFERFYRGEKSRNTNTGGKGLGLSVVKSIVDLHKGEIAVHSDENETVFQIMLPENLINS